MRLIKSNGITLLTELLDSKIDPNEQIILTLELFLGDSFLKNVGLFKELVLSGTLNINTYDTIKGLGVDDEIISIPFRIKMI